MSHLKRCFLAVLALILAACSAPTAAPTALPSPIPPTATLVPTQVPPTATLVPSATATLAPTDTPTPVPTDTPVPTPTITPTPAGYYKHPAGFSLILPPGWKVAEQGSTSAFLNESATGMSLAVHEFNQSADVTLDGFVQWWLGKDFPKAKKGKLGEVTLADGITAPSADYRFIASNGAALTLRFAFVRQNSRQYGFALVALDDLFQAREQVFNNILSSLQLHNWVYGLERSQVIAVLGSQPRPDDLDPAVTQGGADGYIGLLYAGLVRLDPKLQIEPVLAEKWTVSPDGLTYTFTLREGLKFQSGAALTAADVKYSWERAADPKTKSPTAATYLGDIVGVKDKLAGKASEISGVKVIDERTLAVTLDGPKAYFLAKLTYPTSYVVRRGSVESSKDNWMFKPDASGPYGLRDLRTDEVMIFERNPAYFEPAKTPYVLFYLNPAGSPLSLYQAGLIDLVSLGGEDALQVRKESDPLHAQLQSATTLCTSMMTLDTAKAPLDDANVRQALMQALDRDKLIAQFNLGLNVRADAVLPPAMPGYSADRHVLEFDVQAARKALAASKYAGKLPALVINEAHQGGKPSDYMNAIVQMWRENLGLTNIKVVTFDPRSSPIDKRNQHGNIILHGWCADYPDPQNFLDILFHSASDFNYAAYSNAATDQLLEQARVEQDPARRLDLYGQAETRLLQDLAVIPLQNGVANVLVKPYLKGFDVMNSMLHRVSIEGYTES